MLWIQNLLHELPVPCKTPPTFYVNKDSAVQIGNSTAPTKKRKHIDIKHHYLQEHVTNKRLLLKNIPGTHMKADALTKVLPKPAFLKHIRIMGIMSALSPCIQGSETPKIRQNAERSAEPHTLSINRGRQTQTTNTTPKTPNST